MAQAMLFAIEEINNSKDLLPGISLGYKIYDSCSSIATSVRAALALANDNEVAWAPSEEPCTRFSQVQAILGETSSSPCMAVATVIGPFHIPMVGKIGRLLIIKKNNIIILQIVQLVISLYFMPLSCHINLILLLLLDQPFCHLHLSQ